MIYLKYMKSLFLHKYFVFLAGLRVGVPVWRLIIHDWSKFMPIEFINYARWSYGIRSIDGWIKAWGHHQNHNPHHPEYWVISWKGDPDFYRGTGKYISDYTVVVKMPDVYIREMVADWMGSSKAYTGSWDMGKWLEENRPQIQNQIHPETDIALREILNELGYKWL